MADENNKNSNEPISISLKVVIYLAIVSGIFIGSWEIVNNIPKYEYFNTDGKNFIFNKMNGNVYLYSDNIKNNQIEDDVETYNLISVISEEKAIERKFRIDMELLKNLREMLERGEIDSSKYDKMYEKLINTTFNLTEIREHQRR